MSRTSADAYQHAHETLPNKSKQLYQEEPRPRAAQLIKADHSEYKTPAAVRTKQ